MYVNFVLFARESRSENLSANESTNIIVSPPLVSTVNTVVGAADVEHKYY